MTVLRDKVSIGAPHDNLSVKPQLTSHTYKTMGSQHMIHIFDQSQISSENECKKLQVFGQLLWIIWGASFLTAPTL